MPARRLVSSLFLLGFALVVLLFIAASFPQLAGADESYVVLSDSMSPSIKAGAVVFVSDVPTSDLQEGDVITFRTGSDRPVTHRIVSIRDDGESRTFITKGDANEDPDPEPVSVDAVEGQVSFRVPLMGYVVSFAQTTLGLVTLILLPAALLIILEVRDLWRAASDDREGPPE